MVIAARRAYQDLIRWIKDARPRTLNPSRLAWRFFWTYLLAATLLLGAIGLVSPVRFGSRSGRPQQDLDWWVLAALVGLCLTTLALRRARLFRGANSSRGAFSRDLEHHPSFEPAVNALDSCPAALRTRFALGWVWGPLAAAVLAAMCAASSAYFVVDAILARFTVGWEQALLAAGNAFFSFIVLRLTAKRLSVWRLSFAVHRAVARV